MSAATNPYLGATNPYLESQINDAQGDLVRNWNTSVQPAYNSAMVKSGSFGNAGVQQMNDNSALTQQKALGSISSSMRSNAYDQGIKNYQWDTGMDRSIYNDAVSQNNQNLQMGLGLLGTQAGYNTNNLNNGTTIQNTPYNYWSQFNNAANSLGQGYGTNTQTTGSTSNPFASALGGAQLGSAAMGYWNSGNNNYQMSQSDANNADNWFSQKNF